ncbi:MAG: asparaginase [Sulfurimonas sp.]|uniref:asparaginase domain-containing protein n=1 Tax=Sulfurimonas sp. TaxID=2022749 RepID=UPI0025EB07AF|nr:asparaginase domain-containing protein [Sulfurimonas sp.]MCK9492354.1 asparaginase [Sulfurimonas sp.]
MLILNSGGTFNKKYNSRTGNLEILFNNEIIKKILKSTTFEYDLSGAIYKDSLDMDMGDRKMIASIIMESTDDTFIIVHGTDTMDITAEFLSEIFEDRKIILTGSMKPFEINKIEATLNLGMAIGFLRAKPQNGVYICMNGLIELSKNIAKNKSLGKFELVK